MRLPIRPWGPAAALFVTSAAFCACGGDSSASTPDPVASVEVTPLSADLQPGMSLTLVAVPRNAAGDALSGRSIAWSSSDETVALVTQAGVVSAQSPGEATITASSEGRDGTASITVPTPAAPQARWLAAMVYDDTQNRILMFGGFTSSGASLGPVNDLWAWDGQHWTFLAVGGPGPRGDMLAAWDGTRHRLVIYGGADDNGVLGDTWEWDGASWERRATTGPALRRHFTGGFDKARGRVVLAGGLLGNSQNPAADTWEWDGNAWTQRASTIPGGLVAPAVSMGYSETRSALLMLIGSFSSGPTSLLQWTGSAWTSVGAGPSLAMPVPMAATGDDELTLLRPDGATLRWQGSGFTTVATAGPSPGFGTMAYDRAHTRLVYFGGMSGGTPTARTWLWDGGSWSLVPSQ